MGEFTCVVPEGGGDATVDEVADASGSLGRDGCWSGCPELGVWVALEEHRIVYGDGGGYTEVVEGGGALAYCVIFEVLHGG